MRKEIINFAPSNILMLEFCWRKYGLLSHKLDITKHRANSNMSTLSFVTMSLTRHGHRKLIPEDQLLWGVSDAERCVWSSDGSHGQKAENRSWC